MSLSKTSARRARFDRGCVTASLWVVPVRGYALPTGRSPIRIREELVALGLDPDTGRGKGTLSALEVDFERNTAAQPLNPRQGYSISGHLESAGTLLRGDFSYNELLGEARTYLPIGSRIVWANKVRSGTLAGSDGANPFYKRYFVGGSSSVRGWGRYQVAPLIQALPIGGVR